LEAPRRHGYQEATGAPVWKLTLSLFLALAAGAQEKTPTFDVASVKLAAPPVAGMRDSCNTGAWKTNDPVLFTARWKHLDQLILCAFNVEDYQISGGPDWIAKDRYDIEAKPDGPASASQMLLMLRTLLADRFRLTFHRETKPLDVTVLSLSKGGPKFGPQFHPLKEGDPPTPVAGNQRRYSPTTVKALATALRFGWQRTPDNSSIDIPPILDQTGLDGDYEIILNGIEPKLDFYDWVSILDRQLGIKMEIRKVPLEILVIDSVSKPSAN
jgi:uncharacterized protein (TIGR03435 family)